MASITTATSGNSSDGSTWTGGVVPGTTFAGSRTTTGAAVGIGGTSIPVASAAQVVTAGKRIKVAGDPNPYRVATGVAGGSAGNIIIDAPGLLVAIPASATTVSVDMVDDKVTIQHPGTNNAGSTPYTLNGAHSAGAMTINVTGGAGTILAGECIQLEHQLGTDEDGQPYYDNTYYKVTTPLTAGVILIESPGLAYAMAGGVRVVNRGHVVTINGVHCWGDDTSSTTAANNGVVVLGTLKASRSVDTRLTARGTIFYGTGGTVDFGKRVVDPITSAAARLLLNDSASLSAGKHGLTSHGSLAPTFHACGVERTRNTQTTADMPAGTATMPVADHSNWVAGDRVVLASPTTTPADAQVVTISGTGPNWTISPALVMARGAGTRVGNLSSNVEVSAANSTFPGICALHANQGIDTRGASGNFRQVRFADLGNGSGWNGASQNQPSYYGSIGVANATGRSVILRSCAFESTSANAAGGGPSTHTANANPTIQIDSAIYAGNTTHGMYAGGNATLHTKACTIYKCNFAAIYGFDAGGVDALLEDSYSWCVTGLGGGANCDSLLVSGGAHVGGDRLFNVPVGKIDVQNTALTAPNFSLQNNASTSGKINYRNVTFSGTCLSASLTTGSVPAQASRSTLIAVNGNPDDNRVRSYYQETVTDTTTRNRSTYSVKIQPKVANTAITYTFTIPVVSGVANKIKGSLRFDTTYGTATPPSIALSGQGATGSFTAPATADAWHDFELDFTPTSTGDVTATVTVQSASTSGFAWLDGVYHYPMTQSVRHYGYLWQPQANQVIDPTVSLSEAAALALPVTVDHGTNTITVTGNATAQEVKAACFADLVQTANQGEAVHLEAKDGGAGFSTTYDVVINTGVTVTGSFSTTGTVTLNGDVNGVYTDSSGRNVKITAPNLVDGTWYDIVVQDGATYHGQVSGGAGLAISLIYPGSDKTVSCKFAYSDDDVRKFPIERVGVLSSAGFSVIDTQVDDPLYASITGWDPSAYYSTLFDFDAANFRLQLIGNNTLTGARLYKLIQWLEASSAGIVAMLGLVTSTDGRNLVINTAVANAKITNPTAGTVFTLTDAVIMRSDGTPYIYADGSSGSINPIMAPAYVALGAAAVTVPAGQRVITRAADGAYYSRG